jgi:hypothetical protein
MLYRATFWERLDEIAEPYAFVLERVREAGLPDVFAAIPYQETMYQPLGNSYVCAAGYWSFLPETAKRAGIPLERCMLSGRDTPWTPEDAPVDLARAVYLQHGDIPSCRIEHCEVDRRGDLAASTRGALRLLKGAWEEERSRTSGARVQLVLTSFNQRHFPPAPGYTPDALTNLQADDYVPSVIATHLLAACYYGQNYASQHAAFRSYADLDYCRPLSPIPAGGPLKRREGG